MVITHKIVFKLLKIYFNDVVHLAFDYTNISSMQTWVNSNVYTIEIKLKDGNNILTQYNDIGKWKSVIKIIEENYIIE